MTNDPLESDTDEVVARLRAADPAALAEPNTAALRAAVDAARAAEADGVPVHGTPALPDEPVVPDELAARRSRRWTGWPARVAGVAAAALLVGGGGYALGAAGGGDGAGDGDLVAGGAAPAMQLQGGANGAGGAESGALDSAAGVQAGPMAAVPGPARAASDSAAAYWGGGSYGRTVFTASGLSDEATTGHAYGFDSVGAFTRDTIARAAAALGVAGEPTLRDGSWQLGPTDGSGPGVSLYPDGVVSLSYYDPGKDPYSCTPVAVPEAGTTGTEGDGAKAEPAPDPCQQRDLGPAATGDAAAQVLKDAMTALGVDPAGYEFSVEHYDDSGQWTFVNAFQVLDGQRTGVSWSAQLTGAGLQSLYGGTASLVDLGEYAVISPADAVARLTDPRFAAGFFGPMYLDTATAGSAIDAAPAPSEPTVPPTATPGSPITWPVRHATIVKARLGVALQYQGDGSSLLVPTYELTSDDGGVWTVIAVADSELDFGTD